jgi:hypothetical protein
MRAVHYQTVPVLEVFEGQTVWEGLVEVFDLHGHPKANRAYAWSYREGLNDEGERLVAVLEIPPVDSAKRAVQVQIVKDVNPQRKSGIRRTGDENKRILKSIKHSIADAKRVLRVVRDSEKAGSKIKGGQSPKIKRHSNYRTLPIRPTSRHC